jgi:hypothetical protein
VIVNEQTGNEQRDEVVEFIEVAIVELRNFAQPRDIAELRELEMDARDATTNDQLGEILRQAQNLRAFCEQRKRSSGDVIGAIRPPMGRRQT